ncbi:U3 small nucleolar RNA-associated protein 6 homolog [Octodon degus]|uniref:U3 small nucleolar RNA-associated protein 6 homolog n=1 Tax=Octodon degus TaxID=10160 RepID=A0A6P6EUD6_OCTDE|nr:U3 small nucleolar RNA-associated protein 6 homolog [Octodon degus]
MAEIIQERIEDRIPELEQLERVGLFSHAEIKAIIKKASDLEYKIQRRALFKEDFINYVQYEINLLELIQRRRKRVKYSFKKDEIEHSIVQRVQGVFRRASAKWKDDVQLWLSYVVFCKKWVTLWIMAAKWEMEDRLSSESARHLFLRALRFNPECPKLYQEYFRMELMHAEKLRKEKQEFEKADMDMGDFDHPEEILKGELARIIYKNSISKIKGIYLLNIHLWQEVTSLSPGWIELLLQHNFFTEALEVAETGTELFKDSMPMWQKKLQVLIESKSPDVEKSFEEAFVHLKRQVCLPLWISWAEWSEGAESQEDTEAVFKKAILAVTGPNSVTLKEKYLDWAYRSGGYKKARAVFKSLQEIRPFSVEFFRKIIQFEKEQESCKMLNLREYYERALREFGSVDSELGIELRPLCFRESEGEAACVAGGDERRLPSEARAAAATICIPGVSGPAQAPCDLRPAPDRERPR